MKILLIEDDEKLRTILRDILKKEGYTVAECDNGEDGLYQMVHDAADLVILDWMLPRMNGVAALQQARKLGSFMPVILLTAMSAVGDKVMGLDSGADDFIAKPFDTRELLARIRALLRRPANLEEERSLQMGDIVLDIKAKTLIGPQQSVPLTETEYGILELLLKHPDQLLSRQIIFNRVWGPDSDVEEGNIDSYIYFLRRRLKSCGCKVELVTYRGRGYVLAFPGTEVTHV